MPDSLWTRLLFGTRPEETRIDCVADECDWQSSGTNATALHAYIDHVVETHLAPPPEPTYDITLDASGGNRLGEIMTEALRREEQRRREERNRLAKNTVDALQDYERRNSGRRA